MFIFQIMQKNCLIKMSLVMLASALKTSMIKMSRFIKEKAVN